jgi:DNA (cytosine-5)-methyltransferase 1
MWVRRYLHQKGFRYLLHSRGFYEKLLEALHDIDYVASGAVLDASRFGVPQRRPRLVVVGMRSDIAKTLTAGSTGVFPWIAQVGAKQLAAYTNGTHVSARDAISDLRVGTKTTRQRNTEKYTRSDSRPGFHQLKYKRPETSYQKAMHEGVACTSMDSMRLPNHRADVVRRFELILRTCRKGVNLSSNDREELGMLKHRTVPMDPRAPAPTLTTLPDDVLHYREPRILTVRECARIQSFPDWFVFMGKYTTGGCRRRTECPRYTQVGNAVPPLLGQAVGVGILAYEKSGPLDSSLTEQLEIKSK